MEPELFHSCPKCHRKLRVGPEAVGRAVKCPACATVSRVPAPEKVSAAQRAAEAAPAIRKAELRKDADREFISSEPPDPVEAVAEADRNGKNVPHENQSEKPTGKWRPAPAVLRILIILLALAAGFVSATFGVIGALNRNGDIKKLEENPGMGELAQLLAQLGTEEDRQKAARLNLDTLKAERFAFLVMIGNLVVAIIACILVEKSRGWMAGILMVMAPIGPAIVMPFSLVFTGLFALPALLSFLVWRRRPRAVAFARTLP
jgi:hypothetical protein